MRELETAQPRPQLNMEFYQSLWYDSDNSILTKDSIRHKLYEFFYKYLPVESTTATMVNPKSVTQVKRPVQEMLAQKIMGQFDTPALTQLHHKIRKAQTPEAREALSAEQVTLIIQAIEKVLADELPEIHKQSVKKLLNY